MTLADRIIRFNETLDYHGPLPESVGIMNPFREYDDVLRISRAFYKKYYDDNEPRFLILGINPGRFGAGITGIPFTDPKRIVEKCGLPYARERKHEPSSEFIYGMIEAYGGIEKFYKRFYISAVCPLGFVKVDSKGRKVNLNYYDRKDLQNAMFDFILRNLREQVSFGMHTNVCFCLGAHKNYAFLSTINGQERFFDKIVPLEHPRFIMQYRAKRKKEFTEKYLRAFHEHAASF